MVRPKTDRSLPRDVFTRQARALDEFIERERLFVVQVATGEAMVEFLS